MQPAGYHRIVNATPLLSSLLAALAAARLEAVLIGNAALEDILKSKKAAGRERDRAVIPILEQTLRATRTR